MGIFRRKKNNSKSINTKGKIGIIGTPDKYNKAPDNVGERYYPEIGGEIYIIDNIQARGNRLCYSVYTIFLGRETIVSTQELPLGYYSPIILFDNFRRHWFA